MTTPFSKRLFFAGYLCVSAVGIVLLLEAGVRALGLAPALEYSSFVPDAHLPFKLRPNTRSSGLSRSGEFNVEVSHNSMGFRDTEHEIEKPTGVFRIVGLGDSFTYGGGAPFEETYLARLERQLNERDADHPAVEIIKAGIPRYWPEPERLLLEHDLLPFDPDLILVGFVPNDLVDIYLGWDAVTVSEHGYLMSDQARRMGRLGAWLYGHSHVARLLLWRYTIARMDREVPKWFETSRLEGSWPHVFSEYNKMIRLAKTAGAEIAFIHIPMLPLDHDAADEVSARLSRWAAEQGVLLIDTLPALRAAAREKEVYWPKDGHSNSEGYRVIAETVFQALETEHLVPPRESGKRETSK